MEYYTGICQDCGKEKDVKDTECPFAQEIHNEQEDITVCENCYMQRLYDI